MKKCRVAFIIANVLLLMSIMSTSAIAKQLNFSSWLPPGHPIMADMMIPWMENVKKATDGRVDVKLLAKTMGHPKDYMDIVKNGIADVGYSCNSYSAGRFKWYEGVELPFLGNSAEALSVAYWKTYKKYFEKANEYKGVKVIGLMTHGPGALHNSKKVIQSMADMKGLKLRVPGGMSVHVVKALGGVGLAKPASQIYELVSRGVADGVVLPLESIKSFKITKVVPYTTLVPDGLYNVAFYLVMNQKTFNSFSPADQKAVMAESGEKFAKMAGKAWDAADKVGLADMIANGNTVETATPEFLAEIKEATKDLEEKWTKKANSSGIQGEAALRFFRKTVKEYK